LDVTTQQQYTGTARIKLFLALSRTPHGLLDMATPAFGALLWLGMLPPLKIVLLGLMTTFAGYTAVYALNDVVDYRSDKEKVRHGGYQDTGSYLDAVMVRHPMAQGLLSFKAGLCWALGWAMVALVGAYLLNPVCVLIFIVGCLMEVVYCLMWRISHWRALVSGGVKTLGAIAAVFAVDRSPSPLFLLVLFVCLFLWEIGGQNIPADWTDLAEDRQLNARTIPVHLGPARANVIIMLTLTLTVMVSPLLLFLSQATYAASYPLLILAAGCYLLLAPAQRLFRSQDRRDAMALFDRASYFPLAMLLAVVIAVVL
jgi:4-hydroxybenzoate polyprenyltransferase